MSIVMAPNGFANDSGIPTDQVTVLTAIIALIQASVPDLAAENTCFLSMHTDPEPDQRQNIYAKVSPMGGQYDGEIFDGAGEAVESTGCIVTVFSQMRLDRPGSDDYMLKDASRGLLSLKQQVLKALVNQMPVNGDGIGLLLRPIRPINSAHPNREDEESGSFALAFETIFAWDLS